MNTRHTITSHLGSLLLIITTLFAVCWFAVGNSEAANMARGFLSQYLHPHEDAYVVAEEELAEPFDPVKLAIYEEFYGLHAIDYIRNYEVISASAPASIPTGEDAATHVSALFENAPQCGISQHARGDMSGCVALN